MILRGGWSRTGLTEQRRRTMAVRLKDIANDLGVSVVTVSKVLRNHHDISEATRKRVLQRMKELNYRPNLTARALITGRSSTVGLIVPDLLHPFFAQIAKALAGALRSHSYALLMASSEDDPSLEAEEIDRMLARSVDALIIAPAQTKPEAFEGIRSHQTPYVLIDRTVAGTDSNFVGVDDEEVGRLATEHLIGQGCRRIAHIRGSETSTAIGRLAGYRQAMANHRKQSVVVSIGMSPDDRGPIGGYDTALKLLKQKNRPDGVFCFNDPIALGAMRAILDHGLSIPGDVAVVGCGNVLYSDFLRVPLSTIDQDSETIGRQTAELALSVIEKKDSAEPRRVLIRPTVVARASSLRTLRN
jgi:LacI family transcriptional regulator